ncbi:MAG TPA: type II toxin-antitoxin system RelE/ParE family toxin [Candidatus Saccharimonadia bacterium]|nr:type II toxin-antitoxin system RelE/ParE family toxin [Candidatus Saccharimonadia bacterium]
MYTILYKKSVDKDLRQLPKNLREVIVRKIQALADNPSPSGITKLRGSDNLFRIRHTEYRIVYRLNDGELTILVIKVGHRRDVYRDF